VGEARRERPVPLRAREGDRPRRGGNPANVQDNYRVEEENRLRGYYERGGRDDVPKRSIYTLRRKPISARPPSHSYSFVPSPTATRVV
jgi:hypothetical protein